VLLANVVVKPELLYQVNVPVLQLPLKVLLCPTQIGAGLALAVGAVGVALTVNVTGVAGLLQVPLTQAA
jgi:hypothetical protein